MTTHEVDQALAESIEMGNLIIAGQNEHGDDLLQLTAKGVVRTGNMLIEGIIAQADAEKRDFTKEERATIREHIQTSLRALKKA